MRKYADKTTAFYGEDEVIPLEGVVKSDQLETIQQGQRINRINYELCVLKVAREKIRCSANDFIWYGKGGEIATNNKEQQEIAILSLHLLQICMVYINTLLAQNVLSGKEWFNKLQPEDYRGLTPLFYGHINPYGG